ncbi:phospholipase effector Tle1 domain-containing protein [Flavobacterium sp. MMS24-S5]|uniref:phospholipase effector Tle1 domain-containing protein n=1 Tax=Flavobacterium sp. MMS24-S5 TaxID=3416605 RepID=UPI003D07C47A
MFIHTLNIPAGDRLQVTIWEDEGADGHSSISRNMGTYTTSPVDKYGKAELYFNNIKVYQKILNDKDYRDENEHEFYAQVKYIGKIDTIQDTIQLKILNDLKKTVEPPKNNSVAKVAVPDKQNKPENKVGVKVTINVFFDGTKNNMKNTEARLAYEKKKKGIKITPEEEIAVKAFIENKDAGISYANYFSNVAIMKTINLMDLKERIVSIYIEGEGTTNLGKDDVMGYAFGSGDISGIPVKVRKAFTGIQTEIDSLKKKKYITSDQFINEIDVNVFGFSRGATAARNFLSQRRKLQDMYNIESDKFIINFVGLFDTVSSYEEEGYLYKYGSGFSHDFDNDVEELKLKLEGNIKKVFHLTAFDEYRYNFSLTNIKSSIDAGIGYELSIPGVHSDIGGGYAEIEKEIRKLHLEKGFDNIKETLIKEGWYNREQIATTTTSNEGLSYTTHMGIRILPLSYQFIPLAIMVSLSQNYKLKFDQKEIEIKYNVPDDLADIKQLLLNYAIANDGAHSKIVTLKGEKLHFIRNKYLHRSTQDELGLEGRYKDGKPYRKIIDA